MSRPSLHDLLLSDHYHAIALARTSVGHFAVNGAIGHQPVTLLLDTGASNTVVGTATAGALGLQTQTVDYKGGGLGVTGARTDRAPVEAIWLAGFRTHLDTVFVMDIDTVNRALVQNGAEAVDGVIGADVLLRSRAIIDYAGQLLYLQDPDQEPRTATSERPAAGGDAST